MRATTRSMFDAHELGRLGVLGGGPDASAEPAAPDELVEADHQDDGRDEDEHLVGADLGAAELEERGLLDHPLRADLGSPVAQARGTPGPPARCRWR